MKKPPAELLRSFVSSLLSPLVPTTFLVVPVYLLVNTLLPLLLSLHFVVVFSLACLVSIGGYYYFTKAKKLSNYNQRWLSVVFLTNCQIVLVLLCAGPLTILFCGYDPFGIKRRIKWMVRIIDGKILKIRPPLYDNVQSKDISIPMRDGELTSATLYYSPKNDGVDDDKMSNIAQRPVILIRTPYDRKGLKRWGIRYAERGYHLVAQDTRGRFGSTGDFFPMLNEAADGTDTIDWIAKQSWCRPGHVAITGISYLGLAAWAAMREYNPNLKAVAPILAATDIYNVMFGRNSGAAHVELMFRWSYLVIHLMNKPYGMLEAIFTFFCGTGRALKNAYKHAPLVEADTKHLCPNLKEPLEWFRDGFHHPLGTEPFWDEKRKFVNFESKEPGKIPPVLLFAGWYDFFCCEQLHDYMALSEKSQDCRLVVGPYTHWDVFSMQPKMFRTLMDFFDLHLLQAPEAAELPNVQVYQLGNEMGWQNMTSWPPNNTIMKTFHLAYDNRNNNGNHHLLLEDAMNQSIPATEVSYVYDPSNPVPQIGGATFNPTNCGRLDQTEIENRDDVLVFTSLPLQKPMTIAGEIKIRLTVESNVKGTDYVGRVCHVVTNSKDGRTTSENIADGIVRKFDLKPGKKTNMELTMSPVMNRFAVGDQLRIHICSSAYPKYGRHLNTSESFHLEVETNALLSEQILFLGNGGSGGDEKNELEGGGGFSSGGCQVLLPTIPC